jgi:hypothetical protein
MPKRPTPDTLALTVRERVLLFCVGSSTDWQRAGIPGEMVTEMMVRGRDTLRALLPGS